MTKHCPVKMFSAIQCMRFWGVELSFRILGKLTTGCQGDGDIKSAAKILTSVIMDFKRKVEYLLY